ncbi:HAD family hydrolase [Collinsella sp. An268]|uniref:HAD family hydrolase n=1 Tax=Collinsella sp. An268 TaxID=1965612 RepID=UPI0019D1F191|nr:HAD family hydrolase [Collinsella sp. An268]
MQLLTWSVLQIAAAWERVHGAAPTEDDVQELYGPYEERLLSILDRFADPRPHVLDAVAELRAAGVKIGSTTGYNDKMMAIVEPKAAEAGYAPDFSITPDAVGGKGRPFPYMMFRNMEALGVSDVRCVIKVGDTVSDIREGKAAGVISVGVIEGSSEMALSEAEYAALDQTQREGPAHGWPASSVRPAPMRSFVPWRSCLRLPAKLPRALTFRPALAATTSACLNVRPPARPRRSCAGAP